MDNTQDFLELDDIGGSLDDDRPDSTNDPGTVVAPASTKAPEQTNGTKEKQREVAPHKESGEDKKELKCLWISNLSSETRTADLKTIIGNFGKVATAKVVASTSSREGNKYYGFISMQTEAEAQACFENLNGTEIHGKVITIEKRSDQPGKSSCKSSSSKPETKSTSKSDSFSSSRSKESVKPKPSSSTKESDHSYRSTSSRKPESVDARKMLETKRTNDHRSTERRETESSRDRSRARPTSDRRPSPPRSSRSSTHREREQSHGRRPVSTRVSTEVNSSRHRSDVRRSRSRERRDYSRDDRAHAASRGELRHLLDKRAVDTYRESDRLAREREEALLMREREERRLEEERKMLLKEKLERERIVKERLELQREMLLIEKERQIAEQKLLKEAEELKCLARLPREPVLPSSSKIDDRRRKYSPEPTERSSRDAKYSRPETERGGRDRVIKESRVSGSSRERRRTPPRQPASPPRRAASPRKVLSPRRGRTPPPRRERSPPRRVNEDRNRSSGAEYHRRPERSPPIHDSSSVRSIPELQQAVRDFTSHYSVPTTRSQPISLSHDLDMRPQVLAEGFRRTVQLQEVPQQTVLPAVDPARGLQGMTATLGQTIPNPTALPLLDPRQFYQNSTNPAPHIEYSSATFPEISYGSSRSNRNVGLR